MGVVESRKDRLALQIYGPCCVVPRDQVVPTHLDDSAVVHGNGLLDGECIINGDDFAVVEHQVHGFGWCTAAERHQRQTQDQSIRSSTHLTPPSFG